MQPVTEYGMTLVQHRRILQTMKNDVASHSVNPTTLAKVDTLRTEANSEVGHACEDTFERCANVQHASHGQPRP